MLKRPMVIVTIRLDHWNFIWAILSYQYSSICCIFMLSLKLFTNETQNDKAI